MGLTTSTATTPGVLYEVAFLSLLAGHGLAMSMAAKLEWFVKPLSLTRRAFFCLAASTTAGTLLLSAALCLPVLLATPGPPLWALALTHLHLAVLGLVLIQLPIPTGARAGALVLGAWILPAIGTAMPHLGPALSGIFDASVHLGLDRISSGASPAALLPIVGLGLAAWLLEPPTAPAGSAPIQARAK